MWIIVSPYLIVNVLKGPGSVLTLFVVTWVQLLWPTMGSMLQVELIVDIETLLWLSLRFPPLNTRLAYNNDDDASTSRQQSWLPFRMTYCNVIGVPVSPITNQSMDKIKGFWRTKPPMSPVKLWLFFVRMQRKKPGKFAEQVNNGWGLYKHRERVDFQ